MNVAVSRFDIDLGAQRYEHLAIVALFVGGFSLGCELTGALIGTSVLALKRSNPQVLASEAAALVLDCKAAPCISAIINSAA